MNDDAREALRAGLRCLHDAGLWRQLARAALSWRVLLRAVGAIVALVLCAPFALLSDLGELPVFFVAWWLTPLVMRRAGAIISERALAAPPPLASGPPLPLPSPATYQAWWGVFLFCTTVLPHWVARLPWGDSLPVMAALFALQVAVAPGALLRTVLASRFPVAAIDDSLKQRRHFWLAVVLAWVLLVAAVRWSTAAISPDGLGEIALMFTAFKSGWLGRYLALRAAAWLAVSLATGVFTTAVLARFAAASMVRGGVRPLSAPPAQVQAARPVAPRRPGTPAAAATATQSTPTAAVRASPRPRSPARRRTHPLTWLLAVAIALGAVYWARGQLVFWLLDDDLRTAATQGAVWGDPNTRQDLRVAAACQGRAGALRKLAWAGIVNPGGPQSGAALGCAAYHGHLDAVKALLDAGDDIDGLERPVAATVANESARSNGRPTWDSHGIQLTPLQQAVRTPRGLEVAEWLVAHGARRDAVPHDSALNGRLTDAVGAAAADNCLPCLEWLSRHDVAMNGRLPATPLALWFDNPAQRGRDDDGELVRLLALGLSPDAAGADGRTALHAAAAAGNLAAVRLLIARGADAGLADRDGMTPLFYAARRLSPRQRPGPPDTPEQRTRRTALVIELIAVTPSLAGEAVPAPPRLASVLADPYITERYDLSKAAADEPAVRAAAVAAGKPILITDGNLIAQLPHDEARAMLGLLDDAALARAMPPEASLTGVAAQAGWWPELARAMHHWPRGQAGYGACNVLWFAASGVDDMSPGRAVSWAALDTWLDLGARPEDCRRGFRDEIAGMVATHRSPAQQADWRARMAAQDAQPRP